MKVVSDELLVKTLRMLFGNKKILNVPENYKKDNIIIVKEDSGEVKILLAVADMTSDLPVDDHFVELTLGSFYL